MKYLRRKTGFSDFTAYASADSSLTAKGFRALRLNLSFLSVLLDTHGVELPVRAWAAASGGWQTEEKRKKLRFSSLGSLATGCSGLGIVGWRLKALAAAEVWLSAPVQRDRDRVACLSDPSRDGHCAAQVLVQVIGE